MISTQGIYTATSPYYTTPVVDNNYLDIMTFRPLPIDPSDVYTVITATYQYRPDLLAYDLYSDPKLWWVFAARNPNRLGDNPYFNFKEGLGIYIPTLTNLRAYLGI